MSATPNQQQIAPSGQQNRGSRALRLFDDLLFENPEICSTCYCRIRDRTEFSEDELHGSRLGTGNRPTETLERAGDGIIGQDVRTHDTYGARKSYHSRTYCSECGSPGGRADGERICSLQNARRYTDHIIRRLHEFGFYPDIAALYDAVESLKTDPDKQGRDRQIFAAATYLALERGREAPNVPARVDPGPMPPRTPQRIEVPEL